MTTTAPSAARASITPDHEASRRSSTDNIEQLCREALEDDKRATPGPWEWFGNTKLCEIYLATTHSGRKFVMDFVRWGMRSAQPRFQIHHTTNRGVMQPLAELEGDDAPRMVASHRKEFIGIGHADARFITAARSREPKLAEALLTEREESARLKTEVDRLTRALDLVTTRDNGSVAAKFRMLKERLAAMTAARNELAAFAMRAGTCGPEICSCGDRIAELRAVGEEQP